MAETATNDSFTGAVADEDFSYLDGLQHLFPEVYGKGTGKQGRDNGPTPIPHVPAPKPTGPAAQAHLDAKAQVEKSKGHVADVGQHVARTAEQSKAQIAAAKEQAAQEIADAIQRARAAKEEAAKIIAAAQAQTDAAKEKAAALVKQAQEDAERVKKEATDRAGTTQANAQAQVDAAKAKHSDVKQQHAQATDRVKQAGEEAKNEGIAQKDAEAKAKLKQQATDRADDTRMEAGRVKVDRSHARAEAKRGISRSGDYIAQAHDSGQISFRQQAALRRNKLLGRIDDDGAKEAIALTKPATVKDAPIQAGSAWKAQAWMRGLARSVKGDHDDSDDAR